MFRIGEFSKINRLTVKTLRHYDELGLLKPQFTDEMTGYRYYTSDQLPQVQKIIALKQIGLSLAEIANLTDSQASLAQIISCLEQRKLMLTREVSKQENQLELLTAYLNTLRKDKVMNYHVSIKDLPEVVVASMRRKIKNYQEFFTVVPQMGETMKKHGVTCAVPEYCFNIYHDGEYKPTDIDVEICEAVVKGRPDADGIVYKTIMAVPQAACIYHKGAYENLGSTYAALLKWVEDNGYEITDHLRESYIDGIWNKDKVEDWLTEIQAPVRKKE